MKTIQDCFGRNVRLTNERVAHILQHKKMADRGTEIERVPSASAEVRPSRSEASVQLFYEFYAKTRVRGKWLCVVVKYGTDDAFVVTAYYKTEQLNDGAIIWPKK